ncbi:MAG: VIT domain-containing protein [Tepidisphaerales bacterium]
MTETFALRTANESDRIALRGVRLRGRIAGMTGHITAEQTFVNLEPKAIEAVYTFPLPENAAVCGFEIIFGDRVLTGVVEEKEKAIEKYEDAIADGHAAYMVEQHRPDVFSVRVGNLKPKQAVTVKLKYVFDLEAVDGAIRLAFPTTLAPRFAATSGMDPLEAMIDGEEVNPPHAHWTPYGLTMELEVQLPLSGIESPSHKIDCRTNAGDYWVVGFAGGIAEMDRDVVLELRLAKEQPPMAIFEQVLPVPSLAVSADTCMPADSAGEGTGSTTCDSAGEDAGGTAKRPAAGEKFLAVTFVPEFDEEGMDEPATSETVFVLDCSGSMQGESIAQASAALECCLRAMRVGDIFNICRFGNTFEMLATEPLVYGEATLQRALAYVRRGADLGGTELLAPLEAILAGRPAVGAVRSIVLLTDGQVTNEPAVIALARRKKSHNRLFTFGIGSAASQSLVKGLARVSGGAAEFITGNERIEEKVLRTFSRIASPPVTDVAIDYGGAAVEQAPRIIGTLFDGDAVRVFARLVGASVPQQVTLRCKTQHGDRSWTVPVTPARNGDAVLGTFWARAMIRLLEDELDPARPAEAAVGQRAQLVALSQRYGVLCSATGFVAIEHRSEAERNEGRPALRRVPVMLAKGWGGVAGAPIPCLPGIAAAAPAMIARRRGLPGVLRALSAGLPGGSHLASRLAARDAAGDDEVLCSLSDGLGKVFDSLGPTAAAPAGPPRTDDDLFSLLGTQDADGAFGNGAMLAAMLQKSGRDRRDLEQRLQALLAQKTAGKAERIVQTLLAMFLLEQNFARQRRAWKRAWNKARSFVASSAGVAPEEVERWVKELAL